VKLEELKSASSSLISKLEEIGVNSVEHLLVKGFRDVKSLLPEVSEHELQELIIEANRKKGFWFITGTEFAELEKTRIFFSTGSKALDQILGGGVWSWNVAEFYGEMGIGKSQILYTIAVEAANKGVNVIYIDSEGTCREKRMWEIAEKRGYNPSEVGRHITFIRSMDTDILFEVIDRLPVTIEAKDIKLICVDSFITPFRAEYLGREMLAPRQQAIGKAAHKLRVMAQVYNIAVAITNQVVAVPTQIPTHGGFEYKPTGGFVLGHISEPRVWIRRAEGTKRVARVVDSSWLPEAEITFRVTEAGVVDV
jgi:DNA repair protein RadA